ncbi:TPA: MFS transporter [Vibrio vulnificus]|nr:MFS transporter [Vibrio vulnificus]
MNNILTRIGFLPRAVKGILFFVLITRVTYFMVWPFIAIILSTEYNLSPSQVGVMMTVSAYLSFIVGIYGGALSDIYERRTIIILGCVIAVVAYGALGVAKDPITFSVGLILVGISYFFIDAPSKAISSDLLEESDLREFSLQARYFLVNVAAVLGPLIGLMAGLNAQRMTFFITAVSYIPFALYAMSLSVPCGSSRGQEGATMGIHQRLKLAMTHAPFMIALCSGFITFLLFAQIETTLPQYLHIADPQTSISLITVLFSTNAIVVITVQPIAIQYLGGFSTSFKISVGASIFCFAYAMMYAIRPDSMLSWMAVAVLYSVSEAVLMPNVSVQLDKLAPKENRGAFLGVASMVVLGIYTGPFVGGVLLESFGKSTFLILSSICLSVVVVQFLLNNRLSEKNSLEN